SVSHSQYYPQSDEGNYDAQPHFSTALRTATGTNPFNTRNLNPPYRQYRHQNPHHGYNVPFSEDVTDQYRSVKYYGTKMKDDYDTEDNSNFRANLERSSQRAPSPFSEAYRKLPGGSSRNPQFFGGFGISIGEGDDDSLNVGFKDPSNEGTDFFRINIRDPHPQKSTNGMRRGNDGMRRVTEQPDVSSVERPLDALPKCSLPTERIYRQDGQCYTVGSTKACGRQMRFYKDGDMFGDCDCDINNGHVVRPLVYWKPTDSCYLLYHRGPCAYSEWLVLDHNNRTRCAPRHCPRTELESETDPEFWFLHQGKCFKTGQHYNHFCSGSRGENNQEWKVWFNVTQSGFEPLCLEAMPSPFGRSLLGPVGDLPCKPGHKKLQNGDCKRTARFGDGYGFNFF
ncbi:hypothetical protein Ocin01_09075, partial [Orchesella cincta]